VTEFLFFSGKGGVGKTTMACTTAVAEADAGRRVLIVTTDPASNLADVFEQPIGHAVTAITGVPGLWAMEIDPDRATAEYTDRTLAPIRELFPPAIVQVMEEQLAGPCTAEVAAFDRFADFLDDTAPAAPPSGGAGFDLVIFDTAPTGHTVRLLELPEAWSKSISEAESGAGQTCIGPAAAIAEAKAKYERALAALRDRSRTRFAFVLHPEATAIAETQRAGAELARLGIETTELIVNGILPAEEASTPFFAARIAMQERYLAQIARVLPMPTRHVPLLDGEVRGTRRLRAMVPLLSDERAPRPTFGDTEDQRPRTIARTDARAVASSLLPDGRPRTVFFAGKGGVGKTVVSCATAVWLARQGHRTLLVTTDPAAHIGQVLGTTIGGEPAPVDGVGGLWAARVDAKAAAVAYTDRIIADAVARGRSPGSIEAMREELDSPCTEEMAAFDVFIDLASRDAFDATVFDTAPTGHTLRLLELPIDWSRQIDVKVFASVDTAAADDVATARFGRVIEMMRDPAQSTFAFVMYPEATPIVEAARAIEELASLGIPLGLVVANMVLPDEASRTPFARARRQMQQDYLADIEGRFGVPVLEVPLLDGEVIGLGRLSELLDGLLVPTALVA
jgi:arsenite-transporting ATPase